MAVSAEATKAVLPAIVNDTEAVLSVLQTTVAAGVFFSASTTSTSGCFASTVLMSSAIDSQFWSFKDKSVNAMSLSALTASFTNTSVVVFSVLSGNR